ncbi:MAG TPA: hypothetical protein VJ645_08405 [Gaiellaceae bacterium]|jgi:hypothetical protein|nr:hypothetical protein [Gaiellaceae bacterium]
MDAGIDYLRGGMASLLIPLPAFERLAEWLDQRERADLAASIREQLSSGEVSLSDDERRAVADAVRAGDLLNLRALRDEFRRALNWRG